MIAEQSKQDFLKFRILTEKETKELFDPENPKCPFFGYVGNGEAVEAMLDIAYKSFEATHIDDDGKDITYRSCPRRIRLQGPPSTGKTTLAKMFAKLMKLPFVETEGTQLKNTEKLFSLLVSAYQKMGLSFEPVEHLNGVDRYEAPPAIIFIDEVHLTATKVLEALLKVTESKDGLLLLEGKEVDCRQICFLLGTTGGGKLKSAFRTRFQPINLRRHTLKEVAKIVKLNNEKFSSAICMQIAELLPIPREAIRFSETVVDAAVRRGISLTQAIELIRIREGIHEGGISQIGIAALKALADSEGLSKKNLCSIIGIEQEEWDNDVLPTLLTTERHPAYVVVNSRHAITKEGHDFLKAVDN